MVQVNKKIKAIRATLVAIVLVAIERKGDEVLPILVDLYKDGLLDVVIQAIIGA